MSTIDNLYFVRVLAMLMISFALATFARSFVMQLQNKRPHNVVLTWNEVLGEHLLAYPTFYVTIILVSDPSDEARQWIAILLWLAGFAVLGGFKYIADQQSKLEQYHEHCQGVSCRPVGRQVMWSICGGNIVLSLFAVAFATSTALIIAR